MEKLEKVLGDIKNASVKIEDLKEQVKALLDPRVPENLVMYAKVGNKEVQACIEKGWLCNKLKKDISELADNVSDLTKDVLLNSNYKEDDLLCFAPSELEKHEKEFKQPAVSKQTRTSRKSILPE